MITRILGDMTTESAQVADCSIDLLLTDPPYNISEQGAQPVWVDPDTGENRNTVHSQRFDENFDSSWDTVQHDDFIAQLHTWAGIWSSKLRPGGSFVIFISDRYLSYLWTALESQGLEPKRVITWKKPAAVPFNRGVNFISGSEYILWGIKPGRRTFNADVLPGSRVERHSLADKISSIVYRAVAQASPMLPMQQILDSIADEAERVASQRKTVTHNNQEHIAAVIPNTITYSGGLGRDRIHPTQKPTEILKYFIELCTNPGDTVLDTFAGSGSTGIACQETQRNCTLIERDAKMYALMNSRFE